MDAILRPSRFDAYLPFIHDGAGEVPIAYGQPPGRPSGLGCRFLPSLRRHELIQRTGNRYVASETQ